MHNFRRYTLGLVMVVVTVSMLIMALAAYLIPIRSEQPFTDLLRMGWYSFNQFGYRSEQSMYSPPLVTSGRYEEYHDIVVLGDSFTNQLPYSWTNRVAERGWSVLVLPASSSIDSLLATSEFQREPPRVVIHAVVERSLKGQLTNGGPCVAPSILVLPLTLVMPIPTPRIAATNLVARPERLLPNSAQITYARDFLVNTIRFEVGYMRRNTPSFALNVARFSSVQSRNLLVFGGDLDKRDWTETDIDTMRCRLREYRARIEANGHTRFMFLPVPDKLSAYHADLADTSPPRSVLPRLIQPGVDSPRLDLALRRAIKEGQIDVYLPSDTHWGTNGYRVAAETVLEYLTWAPLDASRGN